MRIGIIGADGLGAVLAEAWTTTGHQVAVADEERTEAAQELAERLGPSVLAATLEDVARYGEVLVLTGRFDAERPLPAAGAIAGKIVIDAMNALDEADEPIDLDGRSSSVIVAERMPNARVVKAFNTLTPEMLRDDGRTSVPRQQRFAAFLAGDDSRANARVATLIEELGFTPVDVGPLAHGARLLEPGSKVFREHLLPADARHTLATMR
jgi:8-hydroxy-5-deazaflavin:NADPH oxidoreductase